MSLLIGEGELCNEVHIIYYILVCIMFHKFTHNL